MPGSWLCFYLQGEKYRQEFAWVKKTLRVFCNRFDFEIAKLAISNGPGTVGH